MVESSFSSSVVMLLEAFALSDDPKPSQFRSN